MLWIRKVSLYCFILLIAVNTTSAQRMQPDAPVFQFKLPIFGKDGYKQWDFQGREGHYISQNQVDVDHLTLTIWGPQAQNIEATMESPSASLLIKENRAYSDDFLFIDGKSYHVLGENWEWFGSGKKIIVKKNVQVTFKESIGAILL